MGAGGGVAGHLTRPAPPLFAVADGMGGAQAGEVASRLAAAAFVVMMLLLFLAIAAAVFVLLLIVYFGFVQGLFGVPDEDGLPIRVAMIVSAARFGPLITTTRSTGTPAASTMTSLMRLVVPSSIPFIRLTTVAAATKIDQPLLKKSLTTPSDR